MLSNNCVRPILLPLKFPELIVFPTSHPLHDFRAIFGVVVIHVQTFITELGDNAVPPIFGLLQKPSLAGLSVVITLNSLLASLLLIGPNIQALAAMLINDLKPLPLSLCLLLQSAQLNDVRANLITS